MSSYSSLLEQRSEHKMLTMSDGSDLRVLYHTALNPSAKYSMLFISGWGTIADIWDEISMNIITDFHLIYLETREKFSSVLNEHTRNDLDRISSDIKETIFLMEINENKLVIYASSWAAIIMADCLAKQKVNPFLTVLITPTGKLPLPFLTRYLIPILPSNLLAIGMRIAKFWLLRFKSENQVQASKYALAIERADSKKWKKVAKYVTPYSYWGSFRKINNAVLIITSEESKLHNIAETRKIVGLIRNATFIKMSSIEEFDSPLVIDVIRKHISTMNTCVA